MLFDDTTPQKLPPIVVNSVIILILTITVYVFVYNLYCSARLLYTRRRSSGARRTIPVLNVVPNLVGSIASAYALVQRAWPGAGTCQAIAALDVLTIACGVPAITAILFIRAYYTWMRHKWLKYLGGSMVFATFVVNISLFPLLPSRPDGKGYCLIEANRTWAMFKLGAETVSNVTLSGLYLIVLRQMARSSLSVPLYKKLYREGIFSTFFVVVSSMVPAIVVSLKMAPSIEPFIYGADIVINATIINHMLCRNMKNPTRTCRNYDAQLE
ncbi:hypothetical protein THASP1DRAFT_30841 [Thamnocephalis sphaerospora]|uniref:G-protein coupled receptors family 1 profile domain-containing protein n=1 Tax=Thamnocephalis sphaerospora TaxID=78915 RepID=A0A4P9XN37_9FUNG|nr:hypothetical protein THASP1DRAFT_30841 [Thamnocephalis sphaerospora]|eukprot:RKP07344.1 hypothetical protein THASP1DRAFT_30841 [Thamnocephalis sphaerospora]